MLFTIFYISSVWMLQTHINPRDHLLKNLALLHADDATGNAVFGDSHSAFNYAVSGEFLNLAFPSENLQDIEKRINIYYTNKKCGDVILQADPHLFSEYRINAGVKDYFDSSPGGYIISKYHRPKLPRYWKVFFQGGMNSTVFMPDDAVNVKIKFHDSGWQEVFNDFSQVSEAERLRISSERAANHKPVSMALSKKSYALYDRILSQLVTKSCNICMVTSPVSNDYLRQSEKYHEFKQSLDYFRLMAEKHNVRYLNQFKYFGDDKYLKYFHDEDHLNGFGAKIFSDETIKTCFN